MALPEFKIAPSKMRFFLSERKLFQQVSVSWGFIQITPIEFKIFINNV